MIVLRIPTNAVLVNKFVSPNHGPWITQLFLKRRALMHIVFLTTIKRQLLRVKVQKVKNLAMWLQFVQEGLYRKHRLFIQSLKPFAPTVKQYATQLVVRVVPMEICAQGQIPRKVVRMERIPANQV